MTSKNYNYSWASALVVALLFPLLQSTSNVLTKEYDYIVVGAGSAGSIVAAQVAQQEGHPSVLVLEAGGDDRDPAVANMASYFDAAFNAFDYGF